MFTMNEDRTSKEREDQEDAVPIPRHLVVVLDDNLSVLVRECVSMTEGVQNTPASEGHAGSYSSLPSTTPKPKDSRKVRRAR